jgi:hypothetical protein
MSENLSEVVENTGAAAENTNGKPAKEIKRHAAEGIDFGPYPTLEAAEAALPGANDEIRKVAEKNGKAIRGEDDPRLLKVFVVRVPGNVDLFYMLARIGAHARDVLSQKLGWETEQAHKASRSPRVITEDKALAALLANVPDNQRDAFKAMYEAAKAGQALAADAKPKKKAK